MQREQCNQYNRTSTLMSAYRKIQNPHFRQAIIREKGDVYPALNMLFGKHGEAKVGVE